MSLQDQLRELFLLDKQVRGMRTRLDAAVSRTSAQGQKRQQLQQQRDELEKQLKIVQAKANSFEHQAQEMDGKVNKAREQMNAVKTHKEYQALVVEVNTLKVEKGKIEEQALEQMAKVDTLKAQVAEIDAKITERQKLEAVSEKEVVAAKDEVGARLDEITAEREAAAAKLPPDTRALFNKLANNLDGEAMAEIEEQSRKHREYTCAGCYILLPVERVSAVMSKPDTVITCPSCGRILYVNPELKEAISAKA